MLMLTRYLPELMLSFGFSTKLKVYLRQALGINQSISQDFVLMKSSLKLIQIVNVCQMIRQSIQKLLRQFT